MSHSFTLTQHVNTSPKQVYFAFTNEDTLTHWWCDDALITLWTPTPVYYMLWWTGFHAMGHFTELVENERLTFSWIASGETYIATLRVSLTPTEGGTEVTLTVTDLNSEGQREALERHWHAGLENLASVLETGIDLRITRRPMLGIYIAGAITDDNKEKYGAPHGAILAGVIEGLSAQAAGLQHEDVITKVAGLDIPDFPSLAKALAGKQVGERVEVAYVRDGQTHTVEMELKAITPMEIPEDLDALAREVEHLFLELDAELDTLLEGVTEQAANHTPAPGEWSTNEVLAHLIASERDDHARVTMRLGGHPVPDVFYNNQWC